MGVKICKKPGNPSTKRFAALYVPCLSFDFKKSKNPDLLSEKIRPVIQKLRQSSCNKNSIDFEGKYEIYYLFLKRFGFYFQFSLQTSTGEFLNRRGRKIMLSICSRYRYFMEIK